jgi:transcriptional regulator with XRE-family HTH domain
VPTGDEIRAFREGREQTQKAFAEAMGVHFTTVISWEKERTRPSGLELRRLLDAMGRDRSGAPATSERAPWIARDRAAPRAIRAEDADGVLFAVAAMNRTLAELIEAAQEARAVERQAVLALAPPAGRETTPPESAARPASARTARRRAAE